MQPDGEWVFCEKSGFEARVLQHEINHLNGRLMFDTKICLGKLRAQSPYESRIISILNKQILNRLEKLEDLYYSTEAFRKQVDRTPFDKELCFRGMMLTENFQSRIEEYVECAVQQLKINPKPVDDQKFESIFKGFQKLTGKNKEN